MVDEITYEDVLEFEGLFKIVPPFLLERMAKKNTNLVKKFEPQVSSHLDSLGEEEMKSLDTILNSDVDDLQALMGEAYEKLGKKQFKVLANPDYKDFIVLNLDELRKMV